MMGAGGTYPRPSGKPINLAVDDPNLTQEEKDHRLAIALQQQENAAAYGEHQKKHQEYEKSNELRTGRSGTFTKLAAIRDKDHGMLSVPSAYTSEHGYKKESDYRAPGNGFVPPPRNAGPQEIADYKLAAELQGVEQVEAGTIQTMKKMVHEEQEVEEAQAHRTERSNYHLPAKP
jgi:hypothetical protein